MSEKIQMSTLLLTNLFLFTNISQNKIIKNTETPISVKEC